MELQALPCLVFLLKSMALPFAVIHRILQLLYNIMNLSYQSLNTKVPQVFQVSTLALLAAVVSRWTLRRPLVIHLVFKSLWVRL